MDETTRTSPPEEVRKPGFWAVLPATVRYDIGIPASAKILYAEISALTEGRGYCWAPNDYFERLYGITDRTVIRLLQSLEKHGYIRVEGGGTTKRRIYAGLNPLAGTPPDGDKNVSAGDKNVSGTDKNVTAIYNKKKEQEKGTPPKAPRGGRTAKAVCDYEPELFERFWKAYPRGDDKAGARREWDKLRPDRELMKTMSAVLARQKETDEWRRGIGIPYACRWLRNRRWEDEAREVTKPNDSAARRTPETEEAEIWL